MRHEQDADPAGFNAELERHLPHLRRLFAAQTRTLFRRWNRPLGPAQLDDEVADLVCAVVKAGRNYAPARGGFVAWANAVAAYRLLDRQREFFRAAAHPRTISGCESEIDDVLASVTAAGAAGRADWRVEIVLQELGRLPTRQRDAIRQRFFEDADYAAVASRLGTTEGAARGLVCRGLLAVGDAVRSALARADRSA